jgi:hypothetical protein
MVQARGKEISNAEEEGRKGQTTAFMVMARALQRNDQRRASSTEVVSACVSPNG